MEVGIAVVTLLGFLVGTRNRHRHIFIFFIQPFIPLFYLSTNWSEIIKKKNAFFLEFVNFFFL